MVINNIFTPFLKETAYNDTPYFSVSAPSFKANKETFKRDSLGLHTLDYIFISEDQQALESVLSTKISLFDFNPTPEIKKAANKIRELSTKGILEILGRNLILKYIYIGKLSIISSFLNSNSYIFDLQPEKGLTSMHLAAMGNSADMIDLLKEHKFNIDAQDKYGRTPLHYAALNPNKEILLKLLEHDADVTLKDFSNISPLDLLNQESQEVNPLRIPDKKIDAMSLLLLSFALDYYKNQLGHYSTPILDTTASCLTYFSQIAILIQNDSFSFNNVLKTTLLYSLAQQFTLSNFALNFYLLAKVGASALKSIRAVYHFGKHNPLASFKACALNTFELTLVTNKFCNLFPFPVINKYLSNLETSESFSKSKMGQEFQREWQSFSGFFSNIERSINKNVGNFFNNLFKI